MSPSSSSSSSIGLGGGFLPPSSAVLRFPRFLPLPTIPIFPPDPAKRPHSDRLWQAYYARDAQSSLPFSVARCKGRPAFRNLFNQHGVKGEEAEAGNRATAAPQGIACRQGADRGLLAGGGRSLQVASRHGRGSGRGGGGGWR